MKKAYSVISLAIFSLFCVAGSAGIVIYMNAKQISYTSSQGNVYVMLIFIISGIAALFACIIGKKAPDCLGYKPHFKGNGKYYLMAWLSPVVLAALGAIIYFIFNPGDFDPSMTFMKKTLSEQGVSQVNATGMFRIQLLGCLFLAPFLNILTCGMEELGFRGFLYSMVKERTSTRAAVLITSIAWGIWYMPLAAIGYRYGRESSAIPWKGMGLVFLFCLLIGCIAVYLRVKTGSIVPGALFRSRVNGVSVMAIWFMANAYNSYIGPAIWGILGGLPLLISGVVCLFLCKEAA